MFFAIRKRDIRSEIGTIYLGMEHAVGGNHYFGFRLNSFCIEKNKCGVGLSFSCKR